MAEYYPLLARAVAGLKTSTPQARRAIYERARGALLAQLRAMNPPIPEPDIQRESDALDAAIARLEAESDAAPDPAAQAEALRKAEDAAQAVREAEARAAQERAAREQEQAARAAAEAQARAQEEARAAEQARVEAEARRAAAAAKAEEEARATEAARREEERLVAERAARQHAEQEARLAAEKRAREERERAAAEQADARRREEIARAQAQAQEDIARAQAQGQEDIARAQAPRPAPPPPPTGPQAGDPPPASPRAATLAVPVKPPASAPPRPEPPPPPPAPDITVAEPEPDAVAAPPIAIVAPTPVEADHGDPFAAFAAERDPRPETGFDAPELEGDPRNRPSRPAAPLPPPERPSHLRHILAGGALALALGGIGYAAWVLRDKAQDLPRPKTGADAPVERPAEAGGKIAERIGVSPSAPVPTVQAPAQTIRPAGAPTTQPPPPPIAAPAQLAPARAAFLIQSDGAEPHKTYSGVVNWRVENGAWRADVSAPEVKLALSFAMAKSGDGGPASHKIDLRFQFDDPAYQIGRIGVPELRKEENPYGDRLAAVAVPVTPSVYLIGLRKDDADIAYNLELIRSRGWIDIPMEMADKRIAKITFEKGPAGDATFAEALKGW